MISDIVAMQKKMVNKKAFQWAAVKDQIAESRKILKTCCKEVSAVKRILDPSDRMYQSSSSQEIIETLRNQQKMIEEMLQHDVNITVYEFKYAIAWSIYDILIDQFGKPRKPHTKSSTPFAWIMQYAQSIVNYVYSVAFSKEDGHLIESTTLTVDLYSAAPANFPKIYGVLILESMAQIANKLNLSECHCFIRHQTVERDNQTMISTNFGIFMNLQSDICGSIHQTIQSLDEMKAVNKLISFVDDAKCGIANQQKNLIVIECATESRRLVNDPGIRKEILFRAENEWEEQMQKVLMASFGVDVVLTVDYPPYTFDTAYMNAMSSSRMKAIMVHSVNFYSMLFMRRMTDHFRMTDFVGLGLFSSEQNGKYLRQMTHYIDAMSSFTKCSIDELHARIDEIQQQGKIMDALRRKLVFTAGKIKLFRLIPCLTKRASQLQRRGLEITTFPPRIEEMRAFRAYDLQTKMEMMIFNFIQNQKRIDTVIDNLQSHELIFSSVSISFLLSRIDIIWKMIAYDFPSFKELRMNVMYYPSLMEVRVPVVGRLLIVVLSLGLMHDADIAVVTLKCIDVNFEFSVAMNGKVWDLDMIVKMDKGMRAEFDQLNMNCSKRLKKLYRRPISSLLYMHQWNGSCGVRRVGNETDSARINKEFYGRWHSGQFDSSTKSEEWEKQRGNEKYETREVSMTMNDILQ